VSNSQFEKKKGAFVGEDCQIQAVLAGFGNPAKLY
jgi:hypothetical protein